ncbi:Fanconi anemia group J protein isoform X1 [Phycodurus eques]|uniref:Fanconi anemia group J protein isoform X1 n=1 Tax=Phycodurus eques TaxID=693459 RepID=UPI002ACD5143|nr:Fanconi anemia group J protein isoform X1 [Phycodurus eques]
MTASSVEYTIGGVRIQFPCKAYPSQLAMMNSIIRGLNYGQHCLLESPTGSGKSLALLCSALGWQQAQFDKMQREESSGDESHSCTISDVTNSNVTIPCQCLCHSKVRWASNATLTKAPVVDLTVKEMSEQLHTGYQTTKSVPGKRLLSELGDTIQLSNNTDHDKADFQPERKLIRTAVTKGVVFSEDVPELENHPTSPQSSIMESKVHGAGLLSSCLSPESCIQCPCASAKDTVKDKDAKRKIPKIYFGTRTHKQITQIVHEMKRTAYSTAPMTILSSRDHTCINPDVAPHSNRNELCKDLLTAKDARSCRYFHAVQKMANHNTLQLIHGMCQAWDIEDLVSLGKRLRSCSYYAARELMQGSYIIFCPYNYLLDPVIRESMEIDLAGHILVLDEAHNIEDCARESASFILDHNSLLMCRDELDSMVNNNIRRLKHEPLRDFCYCLANWIQESQSLMSDRGYEEACKIWSGKEILSIFDTLGITSDSFRMLKQHMAAVLAKEEIAGVLNGKEEIMQVPTISSSTSSILKGLFMVLDFLYRDNCRYSEDYRVALRKTYSWMSKAPDSMRDTQGFMAKPGHRQHQRIRVKTGFLTLSFWCLNPAVAFSDLSGTVHSIVLTSGTLSPMGSFSSELGVKFSLQLEASHVINKSQVWVGTLGVGPQGRKLCATFQYAETYAFQDEVGDLLLHLCQVVPKGVLCFLPSYKMLDKLRDRWNITGVWEKLDKQKKVITEPRGGGKGDFDGLLQAYYNAIKSCEKRDGALLMAVCRGKVSEGLDFTDDNARAVITIGIPFPNIKDLQVELKMKYNDQHSKSRGLLPGHRWYEIQAYRALNQALGRCIRHRNDWGALILVDDRYRSNPNKYIKDLSKWVRQLVQHHDTFTSAMQSIVAFSQTLQKCHLLTKSQNSTVSFPSSVSVTKALQDLPKPVDFYLSSHTPVKAEHHELQDWQRMTHIPHSEPSFHPPANSRNLILTSEKQPILSLQNKNKNSVFESSAATGSSEFKRGGYIPHLEPSTTRRTHSNTDCELPPTDNRNEKEEDQTVFYTPELFNAKAGACEGTAKTSPSLVILGTESQALHPQNNLGSELAPDSEKRMVSFNTENIQLSGRVETKVGAEQVRNKIRLSRSRQRAHLSPTDT